VSGREVIQDSTRDIHEGERQSQSSDEGKEDLSIHPPLARTQDGLLIRPDFNTNDDGQEEWPS
jgi:hypothetical protein